MLVYVRDIMRTGKKKWSKTKTETKTKTKNAHTVYSVQYNKIDVIVIVHKWKTGILSVWETTTNLIKCKQNQKKYL